MKREDIEEVVTLDTLIKRFEQRRLLVKERIKDMCETEFGILLSEENEQIVNIIFNSTIETRLTELKNKLEIILN